MTRCALRALYALKREMITLKHAVETLLQTTGRLFDGRVPRACAGLGDYFRDVSEHLQLPQKSIEGLLDCLGLRFR